MAVKEPLVNYNFCLRVDGKNDIALKSVHAFDVTYEYEYIQEGGQNDYVHMRRKPVSQPFRLEVERYVGTGDKDYLKLGKTFYIPLMLYVSRKAGSFIKPDRTYVFTGCTVSAKSYGEMDAKKAGDGLLIEKTTILYQQMVCIE